MRAAWGDGRFNGFEADTRCDKPSEAWELPDYLQLLNMMGVEPTTQHVVSSDLMGEVGVLHSKGILVSAKKDVLVAQVRSDSADLDIQTIKLLPSPKDFVVGVQGISAGWRCPRVMSNVLAGITE